MKGLIVFKIYVLFQNFLFSPLVASVALYTADYFRISFTKVEAF